MFAFTLFLLVVISANGLFQNRKIDGNDVLTIFAFYLKRMQL